MSEAWANWEGQVVNSVFPLRRLLGASDHSGVFLTEYKARNLPDAVIKLIPANAAEAEAQLAQWRATAALPHPRLTRLIAMGRCQFGGLQYLFVVMEYAEQNLAQILSHRALTPEEVRDMLPAILDGLGFLHSHHLVQGRLKPTNILAVGDQLKLASDTIRPDAGDDRYAAARDIRSFGMTVAEALTQQSPAGSDERFDAASLPPAFPTEFASMVRRCLNADPAQRPTTADLEAELKSPPPLSASASPPAAPPSAAPPQAAPPQAAPPSAATPPAAPPSAAPLAAAASPAVLPPEPPARIAAGVPAVEPRSGKRRWYLAGLAVALMVWIAVWAGLHGRQRTEHPPAPSISNPPPAAPSTSSQETSAATADPSSVLHEEIPQVSAGARGTIHGRIQVAVRVTVDTSGNVTDTALANTGSSKYFARLATDAAKKWKFAPTDSQDLRRRMVIFEFSRDGVTGHASPPRS
jgi:TonB family protein